MESERSQNGRGNGAAGGALLTKDAYVKPESVQVLVDLARESAKVTKPVNAMDVVDYSFLDKARKELRIVK